MPRYEFEDDTAEREPLDHSYRSRTPNSPLHYQDHQYENASPQIHYPDPDVRPQQYPDSHHDPNFSVMDVDVDPRKDWHSPTPAAVAPHREWGPDRYVTPQLSNPNHHVAPGVDHPSVKASGGDAGIAFTVAERNATGSGLDTMHQALPPSRGQFPQTMAPPQTYSQPRGDVYELTDAPRPYQGHIPDRDSHSSLTPLGTAAASPARLSPVSTPTAYNDYYNDNPYYQRYPDRLGIVDPNSIADDGDDGLDYGKSRSGRNSMLSLSNNSERTGKIKAGAAGAAVAGGVAAGIATNRNASGFYDTNNASAGNKIGSVIDLAGPEKPEWVKSEKKGRRKWKICIIICVVLIIAAAIVGGTVGGMVYRASRAGSSSRQGQGPSANDDKNKNGDLDINSSEIKELMNNKELHKVFPGMDYTPLNTQYPDCVRNPPSQNNITRDIAVLSQLTNTIRLYGTDCNQTQMVIHAIQQLKMEGKVKIWMGVWQDKNTTTNARQLQQMWDIVDEYGVKHFEGVIVANEILFRKEMTEAALGALLSEVRTNLTSKGLNLPVATSDLGDDWTASLAGKSDYIMANIHPFFAGTNANDAAMWTYAFWQNHAGSFFKSDKQKNIIAEVGWPTQGGTNCGDGTATNCPDRAVAGVDELNKLLDRWVCPALTNGTNYFWFSAFDEPWKVRFNEKGKEWEDQWGLMDVNRKVKSGVKIPDCGGKTI